MQYKLSAYVYAFINNLNPWESTTDNINVNSQLYILYTRPRVKPEVFFCSWGLFGLFKVALVTTVSVVKRALLWWTKPLSYLFFSQEKKISQISLNCSLSVSGNWDDQRTNYKSQIKSNKVLLDENKKLLKSTSQEKKTQNIQYITCTS